MKFPIILAHGQEILAFIFYLGVGALIAGVVGIVAGVRKKKESISRVGLSCAILALLPSALLAWWHGFSPVIGWLSFFMLAPLPIVVVGLTLSLRCEKKEP